MIKLLPCPFCGTVPDMPTKAEVYSHGVFNKNDWGYTASITCPNCSVFVLGKKKHRRTDASAIREACRVWNIRKEEEDV